MAGIGAGDLATIDLYSCFPVAVFNICDGLGLPPDDPRGLTVTGGLPFFGGAGNNYSMHAIAETVQRARADPGSYGFVGANGGIMSKYSVGIYSTTPVAWRPDASGALQAEIDGWGGARAGAPRRRMGGHRDLHDQAWPRRRPDRYRRRPPGKRPAPFRRPQRHRDTGRRRPAGRGRADRGARARAFLRLRQPCHHERRCEEVTAIVARDPGGTACPVPRREHETLARDRGSGKGAPR